MVKGGKRAARGVMAKLRNAEQSRFLSVRAECEWAIIPRLRNSAVHEAGSTCSLVFLARHQLPIALNKLKWV